jgi:hypothetical protein
VSEYIAQIHLFDLIWNLIFRLPPRNTTEDTGSRRRERECKNEINELLSSGALDGIVFSPTSDISVQVETILEGLESCNCEENPTRSTKLFGGWQLVFTNSPPLLKNKGVTGLGSLPFVKLLELEQNLYSNNTAETIERLNIPPFGSVSSSLRGPLIASTSQVE